ncbi:GNAT family N-acetyltransferase [Natranaeroarchaeum sulfidigenes]|uniref:GNAT family N-acetyltransferase n=1 Tax=Natranaeroarchaeum sulfidigenes TaxID=2784880 RepID=UPI001EE62FF6|nr:GNAT family N-acetyltransferase [Natranaeroarchaeum sulfidigenes]
MASSDPVSFEHRDRQRIYEFVERHGTVDPQTVRSELFPSDSRGFRHHISILRRDGVLAQTENGDLRVAVRAGGETRVTEEGVECTIRPARQEDLAGIVGLIKSVAAPGIHIVAETVAREIDRDEALLRHNDVESRMFFVATVDEEVIGWVHLSAPEIAKLRHTAELTLGVLEEYRDQGIGNHLLKRGLDWAATHEYEKVYQSIPASNQAAIDFLENNGWEVEAIREGHYKIDGEYIDEVMLGIEL